MSVTDEIYTAFSRLPQTQTEKFSSELNLVYDAKHFALSMTGANLLFALHRAREARELAVSYRDFRVGAATVALTINRPSRFQIQTGINIKPDKESAVNIHAEQMALRIAKRRQFNAISIVAVVGETQPDQQSGHDMCTLHPCGLCRDVLADHPLINAKDTLIVSALPSLQTIEISTVDGLKAFHDNGTHDTSGIQRFDLPEMELLKPYSSPNDSAIVLIDDESTQVEEEIWNSSIGLFLFNHRMKLLSELAVN